MVSKHGKIFQELKGLSPKRGIQHEIQLQQDVALPKISMYRMYIVESMEIKMKIQELLNKCVIHPFTSPCVSPIVLVPKKDGTWRMCVDFHALNKITIKNHYPLPRIVHLLDQLRYAKYFTKLDLWIGYLQVRRVEEEIWKTAFKTKQELFEWLVVPFVLTNAPATFMRLMNELFKLFIDDFSSIGIYCKSMKNLNVWGREG